MTARIARSALVAFCIAALAGQAFAGYGLEFTARGDTVLHVSPGGEAEFHFTLTNTGTGTDVFEFLCRVVTGVPGWATVVCVRGLCVEPGTPILDTLPAGGSDTTAKVTVYTNATQGEEIVSLRVRSLGDTTLAESIATHTIVGSGVEESPWSLETGRGLSVAPGLARVGSAVRVSFDVPRQTRFSVVLYDAYGRRVAAVADGFVPAGRHNVHWQPARRLPGGAYLLYLTTGGESATGKLVVQ
jgi:rhodanese-related sulfurtransferase